MTYIKHDIKVQYVYDNCNKILIFQIFFAEALQLVSAAAAHANDAMKRTEKFKKVLEVQVFIQIFFR